MQLESGSARPRRARSSFRFSGHRAGIRVPYLRCSRTVETRRLVRLPQGRGPVAGPFQLRARGAEIRVLQVPDDLVEEPIQLRVASGLTNRIEPLHAHRWIAVSVSWPGISGFHRLSFRWCNSLGVPRHAYHRRPSLASGEIVLLPSLALAKRRGDEGGSKPPPPLALLPLTTAGFGRSSRPRCRLAHRR